MKQNWPNTFDFDYDIKEDIINKALTLPQNSCIVVPFIKETLYPFFN